MCRHCTLAAPRTLWRRAAGRSAIAEEDIGEPFVTSLLDRENRDVEVVYRDTRWLPAAQSHYRAWAGFGKLRLRPLKNFLGSGLMADQICPADRCRWVVKMWGISSFELGQLAHARHV